MKFEEFYVRGALACADRPQAFNDEFDQTVFEGAHTVYGNVKSPRYYGNMQHRGKAKHEFIGVWQYSSRLNKADFKRIKDRVMRNLPLTGEEEEKFGEHCLYLQQQDEQRRARQERKQSRRKRRGGRKIGQNEGEGNGCENSGCPGNVQRTMRMHSRSPNACELLPLVYEQLRDLAASKMTSGRVPLINTSFN